MTMRARVFVTLKPSVFDPQGTTSPTRCTRWATAASRTCGRASTSSSSSTTPTPAQARGAGRRSRRQAAGQSGDRELPRRGRELRGRCDEVRGRRLSRIELRPRRVSRGDARARRRTAELVWHKDTDLKGADAVILPGGFAHGDYLRTGAIARFSPIMAAVDGVRRARRPGARHLQRLPGPARGRAAARRDAAQPRPQVPLRARPRPRRADRHAVHARRARRAGAAAADRARRRQLLRRRPSARRLEAQPAGRLPLRDAAGDGRRRGEPERIAQQHRRHLQRSAQRRRPDAASRARVRSCRSAAPTACVVFESVGEGASHRSERCDGAGAA